MSSPLSPKLVAHILLVSFLFSYSLSRDHHRVKRVFADKIQDQYSSSSNSFDDDDIFPLRNEEKEEDPKFDPPIDEAIFSIGGKENSGAKQESKSGNSITTPISSTIEQIKNSDLTPSNCNKDQAVCKNGECIAREYVCDGDYDCTDASDEQECGKVLDYSN